MKTHCTLCSTKLGSLHNFDKYGNYCVLCDNRADINKKSIRGRLILVGV